MSSTLQMLPLTAEEQEHLMFIYTKRRQVFISAFTGIIILVSLACLRDTGESDRSVAKRTDYILRTQNQMILVKFLFLGLPTAAVGWATYKRRIHSFKKDAMLGVKEQVPYTIVRKSYFEHTGQYFFSFDDPNYMHYEVDAATFFLHKEGDTTYLYRAPRSKYVFDGTGKYTLL